MRRRASIWMALALLGATACVPSTVPPASLPARATPSCDPVPALPDLLRPGLVLLFGEQHGTAESPAFVRNVACHVVAAGLPLVVGLELPATETGRVERYLASGGAASDRSALLAGDAWQRDYQDGRGSAAMVELIEGVRSLRRVGSRADIVLFDAAYDHRRDAAMAANLAVAAGDNAEGVTLVLTGNVHSRVTCAEGFEPMGCVLRRELGGDRVVSLDVAHAGGSAWLCYATPEGQQCGEVGLRGRGPLAADGVGWNATPDETGHHGWYHVGTITASPPAKSNRTTPADTPPSPS